MLVSISRVFRIKFTLEFKKIRYGHVHVKLLHTAFGIFM